MSFSFHRQNFRWEGERCSEHLSQPKTYASKSIVAMENDIHVTSSLDHDMIEASRALCSDELLRCRSDCCHCVDQTVVMSVELKLMFTQFTVQLAAAEVAVFVEEVWFLTSKRVLWRSLTPVYSTCWPFQRVCTNAWSSLVFGSEMQSRGQALLTSASQLISELAQVAGSNSVESCYEVAIFVLFSVCRQLEKVCETWPLELFLPPVSLLCCRDVIHQKWVHFW